MRRLPEHVPLAAWERSLQGALFLLVLLFTWRSAWGLHHHDPYEFLRRGYDTLGYYQWLPATFIDHDWGRMYWCHQMEDGRWISLFTFGVAVLQLPFFLLGHAAAWAFGYDLNGFSSPYGVCMMLGAACYTAAGCVAAFRLARRFAPPHAALLSALLVFAATNLYYYAVYEPLMSHGYSFFLIGLFAHCSLRVLDGPRGIHVFLFVLAGLLLVLVRQLGVFVLFFPLLVAGGREGVVNLFRTLLRHRVAFIMALGIGAFLWALQMVYWHWATGDALVFTYGKKGEGFEWDNIVPGLVLFGVRNGWLVYTPLMVPVLAFTFVGAWRGRPPARTILLLTAIVCIVYSAWWSWHLGSGYGHRGFVDLYALLAIPLAWGVDGVQRRGGTTLLAAAVVVVALMLLNWGLADRFEWYWSWEEWTWRKFFEQVSHVVTGE